MWKKVSAIAACLSFAAYAALLVWTGYRIWSEVSERRYNAAREFYEISRTVDSRYAAEKDAAETNRRTSDALKEELRSILLKSGAIDAVILISQGEYIALEKPGLNLIKANFDNSEFSFNTKWRFYMEPFYYEANDGFSFSALSGFIEKDRLLQILKDALLGLLVTVSFAFLFFILGILFFDKNGVRKSKKSAAEKENTAAKDGEAALDKDAEMSMGANLGLVQKLQEEMGPRQDVALFCIDWTLNSLAKGSFIKDVAEAAAHSFGLPKISAFKKGAESIFLVFPGMHLEEGIQGARNFHSYVTAKSNFKLLFEGLYIGITFRTGRIVDPLRLIAEAEKALEKAHEDPDEPIVAFKADPEKYKGFIERNNT